MSHYSNNNRSWKRNNRANSQHQSRSRSRGQNWSASPGLGYGRYTDKYGTQYSAYEQFNYAWNQARFVQPWVTPPPPPMSWPSSTSGVTYQTGSIYDPQRPPELPAHAHQSDTWTGYNPNTAVNKTSADRIRDTSGSAPKSAEKHAKRKSRGGHSSSRSKSKEKSPYTGKQKSKPLPGSEEARKEALAKATSKLKKCLSNFNEDKSKVLETLLSKSDKPKEKERSAGLVLEKDSTDLHLTTNDFKVIGNLTRPNDKRRSSDGEHNTSVVNIAEDLNCEFLESVSTRAIDQCEQSVSASTDSIRNFSTNLESVTDDFQAKTDQSKSIDTGVKLKNTSHTDSDSSLLTTKIAANIEHELNPQYTRLGCQQTGSLSEEISPETSVPSSSCGSISSASTCALFTSAAGMSIDSAPSAAATLTSHSKQPSKYHKFKQSIIQKLLGLGKNNLKSLINNPGSRKFEYAMKLLVKDHRALMSQRSRGLAGSKIPTHGADELESGRKDVSLDTDLAVDLSNLPQELIEQLGSLLQMDLSDIAERSSASECSNSVTETECVQELESLRALAMSLRSESDPDESSWADVADPGTQIKCENAGGDDCGRLFPSDCKPEPRSLTSAGSGTNTTQFVSDASETGRSSVVDSEQRLATEQGVVPDETVDKPGESEHEERSNKLCDVENSSNSEAKGLPSPVEEVFKLLAIGSSEISVTSGEKPGYGSTFPVEEELNLLANRTYDEMHMSDSQNNGGPAAENHIFNTSEDRMSVEVEKSVKRSSPKDLSHVRDVFHMLKSHSEALNEEAKLVSELSKERGLKVEKSEPFEQLVNNTDDSQNTESLAQITRELEVCTDKPIYDLVKKSDDSSESSECGNKITSADMIAEENLEQCENASFVALERADYAKPLQIDSEVTDVKSSHILESTSAEPEKSVKSGVDFSDNPKTNELLQSTPSMMSEDAVIDDDDNDVSNDDDWEESLGVEERFPSALKRVENLEDEQAQERQAERIQYSMNEDSQADPLHSLLENSKDPVISGGEEESQPELLEEVSKPDAGKLMQDESLGAGECTDEQAGSKGSAELLPPGNSSEFGNLFCEFPEFADMEAVDADPQQEQILDEKQDADGDPCHATVKVERPEMTPAPHEMMESDEHVDICTQTDPPEELDPMDIQRMLQLLERSSQLSPQLARLLKDHFSTRESASDAAEQVTAASELQEQCKSSRHKTSDKSVASKAVPKRAHAAKRAHVGSVCDSGAAEAGFTHLSQNVVSETDGDAEVLTKMLAIDQEINRLMGVKLGLYKRLSGGTFKSPLKKPGNCFLGEMTATQAAAPSSVISNLSQPLAPGERSVSCASASSTVSVESDPQTQSGSTVHLVSPPVVILSSQFTKELSSSNYSNTIFTEGGQLSSVENILGSPLSRSETMGNAIKPIDTSVVEAVLNTFELPNPESKDAHVSHPLNVSLVRNNARASKDSGRAFKHSAGPLSKTKKMRKDHSASEQIYQKKLTEKYTSDDDLMSEHTRELSVQKHSKETRGYDPSADDVNLDQLSDKEEPELGHNRRTQRVAERAHLPKPGRGQSRKGGHSSNVGESESGDTTSGAKALQPPSEASQTSVEVRLHSQKGRPASPDHSLSEEQSGTVVKTKNVRAAAACDGNERAESDVATVSQSRRNRSTLDKKLNEGSGVGKEADDPARKCLQEESTSQGSSHGHSKTQPKRNKPVKGGDNSVKDKRHIPEKDSSQTEINKSKSVDRLHVQTKTQVGRNKGSKAEDCVVDRKREEENVPSHGASTHRLVAKRNKTAKPAEDAIDDSDRSRKKATRCDEVSASRSAVHGKKHSRQNRLPRDDSIAVEVNGKTKAKTSTHEVTISKSLNRSPVHSRTQFRRNRLARVGRDSAEGSSKHKQKVAAEGVAPTSLPSHGSTQSRRSRSRKLDNYSSEDSCVNEAKDTRQGYSRKSRTSGTSSVLGRSQLEKNRLSKQEHSSSVEDLGSRSDKLLPDGRQTGAELACDVQPVKSTEAGVLCDDSQNKVVLPTGGLSADIAGGPCSKKSGCEKVTSAGGGGPDRIKPHSSVSRKPRLLDDFRSEKEHSNKIKTPKPEPKENHAANRLPDEVKSITSEPSDLKIHLGENLAPVNEKKASGEDQSTSRGGRKNRKRSLNETSAESDEGSFSSENCDQSARSTRSALSKSKSENVESPKPVRGSSRRSRLSSAGPSDTVAAVQFAARKPGPKSQKGGVSAPKRRRRSASVSESVQNCGPQEVASSIKTHESSAKLGSEASPKVNWNIRECSIIVELLKPEEINNLASPRTVKIEATDTDFSSTPATRLGLSDELSSSDDELPIKQMLKCKWKTPPSSCSNSPASSVADGAQELDAALLKQQNESAELLELPEVSKSCTSFALEETESKFAEMQPAAAQKEENLDAVDTTHSSDVAQLEGFNTPSTPRDPIDGLLLDDNSVSTMVSDSVSEGDHVLTKRAHDGEDCDKDSASSQLSRKSKKHKKDRKPDPEHITFETHTGPVLAMKTVGRHVLAASEDSGVYCYSLKSGKFKRKYEGHTAAVTCLCVTVAPNDDEPDHSCPEKIYSGSLDTYLRCFDFKTGDMLLEPVHVESPILCMDDNWGYIYLGTKCGDVARFSMKKAALAGKPINFSKESILALKATTEGPRKVLIVGTRNHPITVRDATDGLFLRVLSQHWSHTVYSLLLESSLVYCGTTTGKISAFDFASGEEKFSLQAGMGVVCLTHYSNMLFAGCYDGNIYVFNIQDKSLVTCIPGPGKMLLCMDIVKNRFIAGSKEGNKLEVWGFPAEVRNVIKEAKHR